MSRRPSPAMIVASVAVFFPLADVGGKHRREIEREHRLRSLKVGRQVEPRLSRADEQDLSDDVREREAAEASERRAGIERRIERVERELEELRRALGLIDRATYRDLDQVRRALRRVKGRSGRADT